MNTPDTREGWEDDIRNLIVDAVDGDHHVPSEVLVQNAVKYVRMLLTQAKEEALNAYKARMAKEIEGMRYT